MNSARILAYLTLVSVIIAVLPVAGWMEFVKLVNGGGVAGRYYLVLVKHWTIDERIGGYTLYEYNNHPLLIQYLQGYSEIMTMNRSVRVDTAYTPRQALLINGKIILLSYSEGIEITLIDATSLTILADYTQDINGAVPERIAMLSLGDGNLRIGIEAFRLNTAGKQVYRFMVDLNTNTIALNNIVYEDLDYYYQGNIYPITSSNIPQTLGNGGFTVNITTVNDTTIVENSSTTQTRQGTPILDPAPVMISDSLFIPLNDSNHLSIIVLSHNSYNTVNTSIDVSRITGIYAAYTKLVLALDNDTLIYIDPNGGTHEFDIPYGSDPANTFFAPDMDEDGYPEPILGIDHKYYVYYTANSTINQVGWDWLLEPISSAFNAIILNNTLTIALAGWNSTAYETVTNLYAFQAGSIDTTPPQLLISSPVNNSVIESPLRIEAYSNDEESGTYCIELWINGGGIEYYRVTYGDTVEYSIRLNNGKYTVKLRAWNHQGLDATAKIYVKVVNSSITILQPVNNSFISRIIPLSIESTGYYNLSVLINNTFIGEYPVYSGLNNYRINASCFPDGPLNTTLIFEEGNASETYSLFLVKDTVKPIVAVHGLVNNSVVDGVLSLNITVWDDHYSNTTIKLNGTVIAVYHEPNITAAIDTRPYPNAPYRLTITAVDKAGNTNTLLYMVEINNTAAQPEVEINPPLQNNTFIEGILVFNITTRNTLITMIVMDDEPISTIYGDRESMIIINTTRYSDGVHWLTINTTGTGGVTVVLRYRVMIDNHPPKDTLRVNAFKQACNIPIAVPWRNGSFVPTFTIIPGVGLKFFVKKTPNGLLLDRIYYNVSDVFLEKAILSINDTIVAGVNESGGYYAAPLLPGEGRYVAVLRAWDMAGHVSEERIVFIIDVTPPTLFVESPMNNTIIGNHRITLKLRGTDNLSPLLVPGIIISTKPLHSIDLCSFQPLPRYLAVHNDTVFTTNITILQDGVIHIYLLILDESNNYGIKHIVLTIDTKPPSINPSISVVDNRMLIKALVSDNVSGVAWTAIYLNNTLLANTTRTVITENISLQPGYYVVNITSTDRAGNTNTYTQIVRIRQQAPGSNASTTTPHTTTKNPGEGGSTTTSGGAGKQPWLAITVSIIVVAAGLIVYLVVRRYRRV